MDEVSNSFSKIMNNVSKTNPDITDDWDEEEIQKAIEENLQMIKDKEYDEEQALKLAIEESLNEENSQKYSSGIKADIMNISNTKEKNLFLTAEMFYKSEPIQMIPLLIDRTEQLYDLLKQRLDKKTFNEHLKEFDNLQKQLTDFLGRTEKLHTDIESLREDLNKHAQILNEMKNHMPMNIQKAPIKPQPKRFGEYRPNKDDWD